MLRITCVGPCSCASGCTTPTCSSSIRSRPSGGSSTMLRCSDSSAGARQHSLPALDATNRPVRLVHGFTGNTSSSLYTCPRPASAGSWPPRANLARAPSSSRPSKRWTRTLDVWRRCGPFFLGRPGQGADSRRHRCSRETSLLRIRAQQTALAVRRRSSHTHAASGHSSDAGPATAHLRCPRGSTSSCTSPAGPYAQPGRGARGHGTRLHPPNLLA